MGVQCQKLSYKHEWIQSPSNCFWQKYYTSIFTDEPSADLPENEIVLKHLNTLHATRQAFITAESPRKLKLALRKQTRNTQEFFEIGAKVYFKQNIDKKWRGPGYIIGETVQLFILDKVKYCTKLIVHAHNSLLILNIHQHSIQSTYQLIMTICKQVEHYKKHKEIYIFLCIKRFICLNKQFPFRLFNMYSLVLPSCKKYHVIQGQQFQVQKI